MHISSKCGNLYVPFDKKSEFIKNHYVRECKNSDLFKNRDLQELLGSADELWLASSWSEWHVELLPESLRNISEAFDGDVIVFGPKSFSGFEPRKYIGMEASERANYSEPSSAARIRLVLKMREVLKEHQFVDVHSIMCGGDIYNCKVFDSAGKLKTYDGGHLTRFGARYYGEHLRDILFVNK